MREQWMTVVSSMGIYCQYFIKADRVFHFEEYLLKNSTHNAHKDRMVRTLTTIGVINKRGLFFCVNS